MNRFSLCASLGIALFLDAPQARSAALDAQPFTLTSRFDSLPSLNNSLDESLVKPVGFKHSDFNIVTFRSNDGTEYQIKLPANTPHPFNPKTLFLGITAGSTHTDRLVATIFLRARMQNIQPLLPISKLNLSTPQIK